MKLNPEQTPAFLSDLHKMSSLTEMQKTETERLLSEAPEPDEVIDWYLRQDPVDDIMSLTILHSYETGDLSGPAEIATHAIKEVALLRIGAASIVSNVFMRDRIEASPDSWVKVADDLLTGKYSNWVVDPNAKLSADDVISVSFAEKEDREYDLEDVRRLFIASEMLLSSSSSNLLKTAKEFGLEGISDRDIFLGKAVDRYMAKEILRTAHAEAIKLAETDPKARLLLLKISSNALAIGVADDYYSQESKSDIEKKLLRHAFFGTYVDFLEQQFVGPNRLQLEEFENTNVKGLMHESIWLLDMMLLREIKGTDFITFPSQTNQDQPWLNHPALNRGIDFMLISQFQKKGEIGIQLKSSQKNDHSTYHPKIHVLTEKNFMDYDHRRLNAKLKAYRKLLESDFSEEEKAKALKFVLPTALEAVELYEDEPIITPQNIIKSIASTYGIEVTPPTRLNRAQRRQLGKQTKKKSGKF